MPLNTRQGPGPMGKIRKLSNLRPTFEKVRKEGAKQVTIIQRPQEKGEFVVDFSDGTTDRHEFASFSVLTRVMGTNRAMRGIPAVAILRGQARVRGEVGTEFSNTVSSKTLPGMRKRAHTTISRNLRQRDFDRA